MDYDEIEYYIWLQQDLGYNSPKPLKILDYFGSAKNIYNSNRIDLINSQLLSEKEILKLCDKSLEKSENIVSKCMEKGYNVLTLNNLPSKLKGIYAPPCVLYTMGEIKNNGEGIYVAMVGSRDVTPYGVEAATKLSFGLSRCGAVVVSGLALGVDTASHNGALKGGSPTIAVLGNGLDIDYPSQNKALKLNIAQNGAVISEYPPGTMPSRATFPIRNRIIAGLCQGCVVVEASSKSGALITASCATEMGRDVFAVPGSIFSHMSDGTNRLLRDGAKPVLTALDILEEYIGICDDGIIEKISELTRKGEDNSQLQFDLPKKSSGQKPESILSQKTEGHTKRTILEEQPQKSVIKSKAKEPTIPQGLSEIQLKVYNVMTKEPSHVDDISLKANVELRMVLAVLTTLEIEGYVRSFPGKRYSII